MQPIRERHRYNNPFSYFAMPHRIDNLRVSRFEPIVTPAALKAQLPLPAKSALFVENARQSIARVIRREDPRLLVVVGPCSIHDPIAALDYAQRLRELNERVQEQLLVVMRVYFEKPRTTTGWKGLINDPHLTEGFAVGEGLAIARKLLLNITELQLPAGTEALDPIVPQYLNDLISWTAIGARTSESQTHREMASGLSTPVGFKNGTNGDLGVAINGMLSASAGHRFLGIDGDGAVSVVHTTGNDSTHIVLRGGGGSPNYDAASIAACETALSKAQLAPHIMVDASHANSNKKPANQLVVVRDLCTQIEKGNRSIMGVMLESHIGEGNQPMQQPLQYGVSITDACIDWATTQDLLLETAKRLTPVIDAQRSR